MVQLPTWLASHTIVVFWFYVNGIVGDTQNVLCLCWAEALVLLKAYVNVKPIQAVPQQYDLKRRYKR